MNKQKKNGLIGGLILIGIGALALIGQWLPMGWAESLIVYFVLALGLVFIAWGVMIRHMWPMIPGGILSGIGVGIVLVNSLNLDTQAEEGGVFMLSFALGWALITVLTAVLTDKTQWWPLIPGAVMAIIGMASFYGGTFVQILEWIANLWPLALIVAGLIAVIGAFRARGKSV